jgi:hypothetical protein
VAAAIIALGMDIWPAFFADTAEARRNWMEFPNPLYLQFWITAFGMVRLHGGSLALAYGAQAVVSITAALMLTGALLRRPPGSRSGVAEGGDRGLRAVLLTLHAGIRSGYSRGADGLAAR